MVQSFPFLHSPFTPALQPPSRACVRFHALSQQMFLLSKFFDEELCKISGVDTSLHPPPPTPMHSALVISELDESLVLGHLQVFQCRGKHMETVNKGNVKNETLSNLRFTVSKLWFSSSRLLLHIGSITPLNSVKGLLLGYSQVTNRITTGLVKMKMFPNKDDSLPSSLRVKCFSVITFLCCFSTRLAVWQTQECSVSQMELEHEYADNFTWRLNRFKYCIRQIHEQQNQILSF